MNKFIIMMIVVLGFSLTGQDALAKRFGGGRSFSSNRSYTHYSKRPQAQRVASKPNKTHWGGLIRGMLIGGLLASLFMGHGIFPAIFSWLALGVILMILFQLFSRKMQMVKRPIDK
ncbi:hypothetical protein [Legionella yabuuchiae]|uniref:hypothetical protein n=1 Tax=Legionella yabuuchiae TaxID=376727 RepID=UPI001054628D|nr:hypothetical protein [Legionella yabuuchiae]